MLPERARPLTPFTECSYLKLLRSLRSCWFSFITVCKRPHKQTHRDLFPNVFSCKTRAKQPWCYFFFFRYVPSPLRVSASRTSDKINHLLRISRLFQDTRKTDPRIMNGLPKGYRFSLLRLLCFTLIFFRLEEASLLGHVFFKEPIPLHPRNSI